MKSLVVGDIHTKFNKVLPIIDKVIEKYNVDEVVFLGDYVDEWQSSLETNISALNNFLEWINKQQYIDIITLVGNHDYAYIVDGNYCSGHHIDNNHKIRDLFLDNFDLKLSFCLQDRFLCSHAGLLRYWADKYLCPQDITSPKKCASALNDIFLDQIYIIKDYEHNPAVLVFPKIVSEGISACGASRGGPDRCSGPLWADKREFIDVDNINLCQIVGHTPVPSISITDNIIFCDTFSLYSNMKPIGDMSMLLIDDQQPIKIKYKDIGE